MGTLITYFAARLRFGASGMGTWVIPFDSKIKTADITKYVKNAVAVHKAKS